MIPLDAVLGAVLALSPTLRPRLALADARAISVAAGNVDEAAGLVVTAIRESSGRTGCIHGIGGNGTFGLGYGYSSAACGPLKLQAITAVWALEDKGRGDWKRAFLGYLGGHVFERNSEAQTRYWMFLQTRDRIACGCSR